MQDMIHPEIRVRQVTCTSCGTTHELLIAGEVSTIDVCSNCHPAYTGVERQVVGGSRIEQFERRRARALSGR